MLSSCINLLNYGFIVYLRIKKVSNNFSYKNNYFKLQF